MITYELSKDWLKKNGDKVKFGYSIATGRKYDLTSTLDMLKVLKIVDSDNANKENAGVFSKVLQLFAERVAKKFESKDKVKQKTIH